MNPSAPTDPATGTSAHDFQLPIPGQPDAGAAAMPPAQPAQTPAMDGGQVMPQALQAPQATAQPPQPQAQALAPADSATLMAPPGTPPPPPQTHVTSPQVADDVDLIEKEWVVKAKEIVTRTRSDPHEQNKEMNRFKAEYLKKRYNKDIKMNES